MTCLLLIDFQLDFLPGGALAVDGGNAILPLLNDLQPRFDLVVATQDWHPAGHRSFASTHPGQEAFSEIQWQGLPQRLWPDHCVQGSPGAALHPGLNLDRVEAIFRKGTDPELDSYSAFFDNGHRRATGLTGYLRARGITQVFVAGLATDYCVYYSAKDAHGEGFEVAVLEDASRGIAPESIAAAKADLLALGVRFVQASEVLAG
ncbi:bifunctional nicotinamidase/pyrazinamidase [Hymenobacter cheonanensis]|uniref:bifunctional nicotinamidase/pyrazinamidase n=1 Tax=Hymenobacter sp. CA2-7 TaxID=3063993 RepID=UPI002713C34B|nr:bifunctional nicotinamidase/pyrazinamidase [Hymenobacter sp. CA2-7]MDO7884068.1 bifunctional nicotinamidase/pyrazinamidase [Hymenobacter sp. CA2-7]